ncbi:hypothetical protein ACOBR2_13545 [Telmatobacter bradus]|uniref:hypothetical protein n=1 Tax=Telmatobacter bradus TaxID=474953 RepID=UPI003B434A22
MPKICPHCDALYPSRFTICPEHGCTLVEAGRTVLVMPRRKHSMLKQCAAFLQQFNLSLWQTLQGALQWLRKTA